MAENENVKSKSGKPFFVFIIVVGILLILMNIVFSNTSSESTVETAENKNEADESVNTNDLTLLTNEENEEFESKEELYLFEFGFWIPEMSESVSATTSDDGETVTLDFGGNNIISSMPLETESIIQGSYSTKTEDEITIGGYSGKRITGISAKDGSEVNYMLIPTDEQLLFVRGEVEFIDGVEAHLKLR